jgi:beta-lactamase class A
MRLTLTRVVAAFLLGTTAYAADLQKQVEAIAQQHHGKVALYAKNLKTGAEVAIDADEPVQTASVIKVAILMEVFSEAKAGKLSLDERLPLTKENQVPGSGILTFLQAGLQPTVQDAVVLMTDLSDNTATNLLIDKVTVAAVDKKITDMGLKNTWLYKKVFKPAEGPMPADQKKFGLGKTTAREMAQMFESIDRCDLGDAALCKRMLQILKDQQDNNEIPRFIQYSDTSEKPSAIAHKTGALDDVRNDVGIVYTTAGPIVISAFTWDNKDHSWTADNEAMLTIAKMSKAIVESWAPKGLNPAAAKPESPKK